MRGYANVRIWGIKESAKGGGGWGEKKFNADILISQDANKLSYAKLSN